MKTNAILIAAMALMSNAAIAQTHAKPVHRFVVTDYGAVADGKTVNTKAIQAAIDKCASSGGGMLVIPKGIFLSGSIFLKQGVNLLVEKDGVLKGTTNIDDYPELPELPGGLRGGGTAALVNADGVTGLTFSGEGTIDGNGELWEQNHPRRLAGPAPQNPGLTPPEVGRGRPRLIAIKNAKDVQVARLNLHNQASW